jgi:hypothetical protein
MTESKRTYIKVKDLCNTIMVNMFDNNENYITSWFDFNDARRNNLVSEDVPRTTLLRVLNYGVKQGLFIKEWRGVGMTPWSGSAKRQRDFELTSKGKWIVLSSKCNGMCMIDCKDPLKSKCQALKKERESTNT